MEKDTCKLLQGWVVKCGCDEERAEVIEYLVSKGMTNTNNYRGTDSNPIGRDPKDNVNYNNHFEVVKQITYHEFQELIKEPVTQDNYPTFN